MFTFDTLGISLAREYQNDMREERQYYGRLPTKANIAEFYREQKTTSHPSQLR